MGFSSTAMSVGPSVQTAEVDDNAITLAKLAGGTAGKVIGFDGGGDPAELSGGEEGEGHVTIPLIKPISVGQGTWSIAIDVGQAYNFINRNSTGDDGDNISFNVYLATGTYTLQVLHLTTADCGITDIYIDAVEIASIDMYSSGTTKNVVSEQGSIAVTGGLKVIKLLIDGKNGSSSNYFSRPTALIFTRTA